MKRETLFVIFLLFFIALTSHRTQYERDFEFLKIGVTDTLSYMKIAEAAPALPSSQQAVVYHHAQRLFIPYVVGLISKATGVHPYTGFFTATLICAFMLLWMLSWILRSLGLQGEGHVFLLALYALNPYSIRYFITQPAIMNDLAFALGTAGVLYGLIVKRTWVWIAWLILASLSRQTALTLIFPILAWIGLLTEASPAQKWIRGFFAVAIPTGIYFETGAIAATFAQPSYNAETALGIFSWLTHEFSLSALIEFWGRGLLPLLLPFGIICTYWGQRKKLSQKDRRLIVLLLFCAVCIGAQPYFGGPRVTGQSVLRLGNFSAIPLIVIVGLLFKRIGFLLGPHQGEKKLALGILLAMGSFHHIYSYNALLSSERALQFAIIYAFVSLAVIGIFWADKLKGAS